MNRSIVPIVAMAAESERAAIDQARGNIARALSEATGNSWTCDCQFVQELDLRNADIGSIVVTSLVSEVDTPERWEHVEPRLRKIYAGLCERRDPVFICTVLRHTGAGDSALAVRRRIRIRRLNLLAAELSRDYGAFVIDIDRQLADVGARRLETDYTLRGEAAAKLAGNAIAVGIVLNGLDGFVSVEMQDRAKAALAQSKSTVALLEIKPILLAMGQGRRKQISIATIDTDQQAHVGWLIHQVLQRQIALPEAFEKLRHAIRQRGTRESLAMLASGVVRLIGKGT
jgi:hypothetical protein